VSRAMDAKWLLSRADESGVVAMDVKWLPGRVGKSVVAIGCCVKWVGLIMQISRVGGAYCFRTVILLERLFSDCHSIPTDLESGTTQTKARFLAVICTF